MRTDEEFDKEEIHTEMEDADTHGDNSDDEVGYGSEGIKMEIWATLHSGRILALTQRFTWKSFQCGIRFQDCKTHGQLQIAPNALGDFA